MHFFIDGPTVFKVQTGRGPHHGMSPEEIKGQGDFETEKGNMVYSRLQCGLDVETTAPRGELVAFHKAPALAQLEHTSYGYEE